MHTLSMGLKALEETNLCHREMRRSSRGLLKEVCVCVCVFREIEGLNQSTGVFKLEHTHTPGNTYFVEVSPLYFLSVCLLI